MGINDTSYRLFLVASSAEFVWPRGLREISKRMIQNEFEHLKGSMPKAARKGYAGLVVHPLDHGAGILALGPEVVQQEIRQLRLRASVS